MSAVSLVMLSHLGCLSRGTLRLHTHLGMVSFLEPPATPGGERGK